MIRTTRDSVFPVDRRVLFSPSFEPLMASTKSELQPVGDVESPHFVPRGGDPCGSFGISDQVRGRFGTVVRSLILSLLLFLPGRGAFAEITVAARAVVVIRGGDLVLPLASDSRTEVWPRTVDARCGGRSIEGRAEAPTDVNSYSRCVCIRA